VLAARFSLGVATYFPVLWNFKSPGNMEVVAILTIAFVRIYGFTV
jgi:hypothetical protein